MEQVDLQPVVVLRVEYRGVPVTVVHEVVVVVMGVGMRGTCHLPASLVVLLKVHPSLVDVTLVVGQTPRGGVACTARSHSGRERR